MYFYKGDGTDVNISMTGWHKMSITEEWVIHGHVWCAYEHGMRIPFSKQYRYVTNHLYSYVTNYYIFVCTLILLLLTAWHNFVSDNIPWKNKIYNYYNIGQN